MSVVSGQLVVVSAAFLPQQPIPRRFTCDGEDISPELSWFGVPDHAEAFALVMEDPDAPLGVFTHWVYSDLPGTLREHPEDVDKVGRPRLGGVQGVNDFGNMGFNGPCPPPGPAGHYHLVLFALDRPLALPPRHSKHELRQAMRGRVLAQGELVGIYRRNR
jgi:Raf kinase inhibitor-like YbhB/YbcL family protein